MRGLRPTAGARPDRCRAAHSGPSRTGAVAVDGRHEATPGGAAVADPDTADADTSDDRPWVTIVWDDPVNLMRYVTYVFQKLFGYSETRAAELMMQVHTQGKAVVSSGDRDKVEIDVRKLHAAGLWATMQRDS
ncbi:ATP-dependent Clp protease adapter ClpS [Williamsia sp. SKLECPSW1]